MFDVIKEILISRREFPETDYKRLQKAKVYIGNDLIDSDGGLYLTADSLIEINNIITSSNNFTLRKVNVKPCEFNKIYMDKKLIENKLYQIIDQLNERKVTSTKYIYFMMEMVERVRYCLLMMI